MGNGICHMSIPFICRAHPKLLHFLGSGNIRAQQKYLHPNWKALRCSKGSYLQATNSRISHGLRSSDNLSEVFNAGRTLSKDTLVLLSYATGQLLTWIHRFFVGLKKARDAGAFKHDQIHVFILLLDKIDTPVIAPPMSTFGKLQHLLCWMMLPCTRKYWQPWAPGMDFNLNKTKPLENFTGLSCLGQPVSRCTPAKTNSIPCKSNKKCLEDDFSVNFFWGTWLHFPGCS